MQRLSSYKVPVWKVVAIIQRREDGNLGQWQWKREDWLWGRTNFGKLSEKNFHSWRLGEDVSDAIKRGSGEYPRGTEE